MAHDPRNDRVRDTINRRSLLRGGAGLAGVAALGLRGVPVWASEPVTHTFKHGAFEVIIVSDGYMLLPAGAPYADVDPKQLEAALAAAGQTGGTERRPTNATLVRTDKDLILFDTGAGPNFLATTGKLTDNLAAVGIAPEQVTKVVFTHGHADHLWGTIDEFEGAPRFPKATHYMASDEVDLWMAADAATRMPADRSSWVQAAQRNLKGIEGQLQTFKPGDEIVPGLRAIASAGHTQGHVSYEIAGSSPLVVLGDALIHPVISFQHPEWRSNVDHEPDRAVETRKRLLDKLTTDKAVVIGYHLPFPGLGSVERKDAAYRFIVGG